MWYNIDTVFLLLQLVLLNRTLAERGSGTWVDSFWSSRAPCPALLTHLMAHLPLNDHHSWISAGSVLLSHRVLHLHLLKCASLAPGIVLFFFFSFLVCCPLHTAFFCFLFFFSLFYPPCVRNLLYEKKKEPIVKQPIRTQVLLTLLL